MHWLEKIYESLTEGKPVRDPHAPLTGALDHLNRYRTPPKGGWKEGGAAGEDVRDKDRPHWRPTPGEDPTPPWRREDTKKPGSRRKPLVPKSDLGRIKRGKYRGK